jgi:hypothetical protein
MKGEEGIKPHCTAYTSPERSFEKLDLVLPHKPQRPGARFRISLISTKKDLESSWHLVQDPS